MGKKQVVLVVLLFASTILATQARILSMGKQDAFFLDEESIYRNPANASLYPNLLMGSLGDYIYDTKADSTGGQYEALNKSNRDPLNPFFGAILSYSLNKDAEGGNQYPMLSVGAVFNRKDPLLRYLTYNPFYSNEIFNDVALTELSGLVKPVGNVDIILSFAMPNGAMVGAGTYLAFNQKADDKEVTEQATLFKVNAGINWPLAQTIDFEASLNIASISAFGQNPANNEEVVYAKGDYYGSFEARLFSALNNLNGDFVPRLRIDYLQLLESKYTNTNVSGGIGINLNIDKGFFWAAMEGLYVQQDVDEGDKQSQIGAQVSFGIERNVVWDWFVVRVGGKKRVMLNSTDGGNSTYWQQNPESYSPHNDILFASNPEDDLVGFGIGLNVENRLKFDIVVAEDLPYTLGNLISGPHHHLFTRIDATYSF